MSEHHPFGMSKWPAWLACPKYESGPESDASRGGTEAHRLMGKALAGEILPADADSYLAGVAEWAATQLLFYGDGWMSEHRVQIGGSGPLAGIFGTADAVLVLEDRIIVADLKAYSRGESDYFAQLMGYALAVLQVRGMLNAELLVLHGGSRKVESRQVTVGECLDVAEGVIEHRLDPFAEPLVCRHCAHCASLSTCPAVHGTADNALAANHATLSYDDVCLWLERLPALSAFCDAVKLRGIALAEANGGEIVSEFGVRWKVAEKAGARKIGDALAAFRAVSDVMDASQFLAVCTVPVAAFERAVKSCGVPKDRASEIVDSVSERGAPSRSLVKARE